MTRDAHGGGPRAILTVNRTARITEAGIEIHCLALINQRLAVSRFEAEVCRLNIAAVRPSLVPVIADDRVRHIESCAEPAERCDPTLRPSILNEPIAREGWQQVPHYGCIRCVRVAIETCRPTLCQ